MALKYWKICGIELFGGDKSQVLELAGSGGGKKPFWIATVNPEFVVKATKDRQFFEILKHTGLNVVDGVSLFWIKEVEKEIGFWRRLVKGWKVGLEILGGKFDKQMVRGSELMVDLVRVNKRVFLLGGFGNVGEKTEEYLRQITNHKSQITSCAGEPKFLNIEVLEKITESKPDLLLVAYGMVKQEKWIEANFENLKKAGVKVVMGVGRSFDYYGGKMKPPSEKWRKMGLEWFYSLIQEPKRIVRQWEIVKFVVGILFNRNCPEA